MTVEGCWERQTDQTIRETSMRREIHADDEYRELVVRETTVQVTDKITVLDTSHLMAGSVQRLVTGDYSVAAGGGLMMNVAQNVEIHATNLNEKVAQLRRTIAGAKQEIIAPVNWVGSSSVNILQLMLEMLTWCRSWRDRLPATRTLIPARPQTPQR